MALGTRLGENLPDDGSGIGDEGANHQEVPVMDGANLGDFIELFRNKSHPCCAGKCSVKLALV